MTARSCDICGGAMRPEPDGNTKRLVCVECDTPLTPVNLKSQAKASVGNGATGSAMKMPSDSMTGEASRADAGRSASATSEIMDVTARRDGASHFSVAGFARAVERGLRNGPKSALQAKAGS